MTTGERDARLDGYVNPIVDILLAPECDPEWLVPDLLLQGTMSCYAGEPGTGKSYVTYTLGLALASGCPALSGVIPAGPPRRVVYFDQENSPQDRNKYITRAWHGLAAANGTPPDPAVLVEHFFPVHFRLGDAQWFDTAAAFVEHFQPALMVFDTAASCFDVESENDNAEAAKVVRQLRQLMALTDPVATCLVLKHAKSLLEKGGKRRMRGATMWQSLTDQTMFQVRGAGRPRKHGLQLTRIEPDKSRAFGLTQPIFISPTYTDDRKTGLRLDGSHTPDRDHATVLAREGDSTGEDA